jgi:predicted ATPase
MVGIESQPLRACPDSHRGWAAKLASILAESLIGIAHPERRVALALASDWNVNGDAYSVIARALAALDQVARHATVLQRVELEQFGSAGGRRDVFERVGRHR